MTYVHRRLRKPRHDRYLLRVPPLPPEDVQRLREQFTKAMRTEPLVILSNDIEVYRR